MNNASSPAASGERDDGLPVEGKREGRLKAGHLAQIGALSAAIVASACCWLPLLLAAFGVSGGILSARFAALRPVLLPVTFALLGAAFYFAYRKPKVAVHAPGDSPDAGGDACCTVAGEGTSGDNCCPQQGARGLTLKKVNRVMLWAVTVFVLAFAFFPSYVGYLLGGGGTLVARGDLDEVVVKIEGMTCEGCEVTLRKALASVPGVNGAAVSFAKGQAVVAVSKDAPPPRAAILEAIVKAGFKGQFQETGNAPAIE